MRARGHGEKLSRKPEQAVAALLAHPTVAAAAAACGVSEASLWRWLQMPEFQTRYREARRLVVERAIGELQQAGGEAVGALRHNLTCRKPAVEVGAAKAILEQSLRAVELIDLEERLRHLEEAMGQSEMSRKRGAG